MSTPAGSFAADSGAKSPSRSQGSEDRTMRVGAHVSTAGGLDKAIDRAQAMGAETVQIFGGPPQTWRRRTYTRRRDQGLPREGQCRGCRPRLLPRHLPHQPRQRRPRRDGEEPARARRRPGAVSTYRRQGEHRPRRQPQGRRLRSGTGTRRRCRQTRARKQRRGTPGSSWRTAPAWAAASAPTSASWGR